MSHPPSSPRRQYPLLWFEQNFDTEEKIATLLRPELDSGNLTLHDYELSKVHISTYTHLLTLTHPQDFYPRKHRFLPVCTPPKYSKLLTELIDSSCLQMCVQ